MRLTERATEMLLANSKTDLPLETEHILHYYSIKNGIILFGLKRFIVKKQHNKNQRVSFGVCIFYSSRKSGMKKERKKIKSTQANIG